MAQQESACARRRHAGANQLVRSNQFAFWSVCSHCGQRSSYTSLTGRSSWSHLSEPPPNPSWRQTAPLRKGAARAPLTEDGEQILDLGKHRGRTYLWTYTHQPEYCYWVINQDHGSDCSAGLHAFADEEVETIFTAEGAPPLPEEEEEQVPPFPDTNPLDPDGSK